MQGLQGIAARVSQAATEAIAAGVGRTLVAYDLRRIRDAWLEWQAELPGVRPFYAVKCNPDPTLLQTLSDASAGRIGFDCASPREIDAVLAIEGASAARDIVYAHPCKHPADIEHAVRQGVRLTTFDSVHELGKLGRAGLRRALLRVVVPQGPGAPPAARVDLGAKYGADAYVEAATLLDAASACGVDVVGVSFHVGSACTDTSAFDRAVRAAAHVLALLEGGCSGCSGGSGPHIMDIGGGFGAQAPLCRAAPVIRRAIAEHVAPRWPAIELVAEPGRFFVEQAATIFTPIIGKRVRPSTGTREYFITDGLYGSFNCVLYDGQAPNVHVFRRAAGSGSSAEPDATHASNVWGPTCDSADVVARGLPLPDLQVGDWLAFSDAGAYTVAGACDFNGIPMSAPDRIYVP